MAKSKRRADETTAAAVTDDSFPYANGSQRLERPVAEAFSSPAASIMTKAAAAVATTEATAVATATTAAAAKQRERREQRASERWWAAKEARAKKESSAKRLLPTLSSSSLCHHHSCLPFGGSKRLKNVLQTLEKHPLVSSDIARSTRETSPKELD